MARIAYFCLIFLPPEIATHGKMRYTGKANDGRVMPLWSTA